MERTQNTNELILAQLVEMTGAIKNLVHQISLANGSLIPKHFVMHDQAATMLGLGKKELGVLAKDGTLPSMRDTNGLRHYDIEKCKEILRQAATQQQQTISPAGEGK